MSRNDVDFTSFFNDFSQRIQREWDAEEVEPTQEAEVYEQPRPQPAPPEPEYTGYVNPQSEDGYRVSFEGGMATTVSTVLWGMGGYVGMSTLTKPFTPATGYLGLLVCLIAMGAVGVAQSQTSRTELRVLRHLAPALIGLLLALSFTAIRTGWTPTEPSNVPTEEQAE
jgi:hypothetical protein